jgi:hypothetical protein
VVCKKIICQNYQLSACKLTQRLSASWQSATGASQRVNARFS